MDSTIEDKKTFSFEDLKYWSSISFTISFVAAMNYILLFRIKGLEGFLLPEVITMYIVLIFSLAAVTVVYDLFFCYYEKTLGKYLIFIALTIPAGLLFRIFMDINYLKYVLPFFMIMPLLVILVGLLYKKIFASMNLMLIVMIVLGVSFSFLIPDNYVISSSNNYNLILYHGMNLYIISILYSIYFKGVMEEHKTVETALYTMMKGILWPGYLFFD